MATQLSRTGQHVSSPICHNAGHQFVTMLVTSAMRFEEAPDVMPPLRYVWPGGKIYPAFEAVGAREPCLRAVEGLTECQKSWPGEAPKWHQDSPKMAQDGPKTPSERPQHGPKTAEANSSRCGKPSKAPRWPQDGSKMVQDGPKTASERPQDGPRRPKIAPRRLQNDPKMAQDDPKTAEDGLKTAEDGPRSPKIGARWAAVRHGCAEAHGGEPKRI